MIKDEKALIEEGYGPTEIKADKQPIGKFENLKPYTNHQIEVEKGNTLYIFSDGFADQFGGEEMAVHKKGGKKFKSKNFKKLLLSYQKLPMSEQREAIDQAFEQWKGVYGAGRRRLRYRDKNLIHRSLPLISLIIAIANKIYSRSNTYPFS